MAVMMNKKYPLKSANFSAIGVAVSPGSAVKATERSVDDAVKFITTFFFSSSDLIDAVWFSAEDA